MKPDWKDAPEWANWLAMDYNHEWFWHENEPFIDHRVWESGRIQSAGVVDFKKTLEKRP